MGTDSDSESPASAASQGDDDSGDQGDPHTAAAPLLRVVNPDATPEEVAALVAVFAAPSGPQTPAIPTQSPGITSEWPVSNRHHTSLRHRLNGWRASALPH